MTVVQNRLSLRLAEASRQFQDHDVLSEEQAKAQYALAVELRDQSGGIRSASIRSHSSRQRMGCGG